MVKKGLITDLAKVIQSLDLSSPNMSVTVNSLLKTLEFLSKTLNYPPNLYTTRGNRSRSNITISNNQIRIGSVQPEVMEEDNVQEETVNTEGSNIATDSEAGTISGIVNADNAPSSNVEDNSDLYAIESAFNYNSHSRSGTFTSDDLRTDEDEDDVLRHRIVASDLTNNHSELHENTINSNCVESESSDDTQTDEEEEDEIDEEEEEEEEDAAGSTQDEHEEDEEEQPIEEEEDLEENYLEDLIDEGFRSFANSSAFLQVEDLFPSFMIRTFDRYNPFGNNEEASLNNDASQLVISTPDILVQHPLLSNNIEIAANASQFYSINQSNPSNSNLISRHSRGNRSRTFRTSVLGANNPNWHLAASRNNTSVILHRLLGSSYIPQDIMNGISSRGTNILGNNLDIPEEDLYHSSNSNGFASSYSSSTNQNSSLNSIPNTMCRWFEECRVLDGEYMYDAIFLIKSEIMKCLEKYKEDDLKEKEKKKNEEVKINSLIKELKAQKTDGIERAITTRSDERIDDNLHAHIEELTNSVINQVLEPSSRQNSDSLQINNDSLSPDSFNENNQVNYDVPEPERIEMEVVNDESLEGSATPMATDANCMDTPASESGIIINVDVNELMDQSSNERSQEQTSSNVESLISSNESNNRVTYNLTAEEKAILGDQEIPEGVDPSFLAALPENIRQEVIAEQFRLQRINNVQQQQQQQSTQPSSNIGSNSASLPSFNEVNPEFLAALPLNIQEEVLAQQRAEQQRLNPVVANSDAPVDPDSFFRSLPPSLRRQVLSDLDDSQLQLLPDDIASEARTLRQEFELRHRQFQERLFSSSTALSRIIRSASMFPLLSCVIVILISFIYFSFCSCPLRNSCLTWPPHLVI